MGSAHMAGGNYPLLKMDKSRYGSSRILDVSCGDGRNVALREDLGFEVHDFAEKHPHVVEQMRRRLQEWNSRVTARYVSER